MNTNHRRIKINVSWKWGLFFFLMSVVFSSCIDDFDVKKLQDTPRLVLYCFPTEGDTTLIVVTKSLPVSSFKGDIDTQSRLTVDASVVYKVNGMPQEVKRIENIKEAQSFSQVSDSWSLSTLIGQYYAVGKQKAGDKIEVQVSADGLSEVSASTSIPEKVDVNIGDIHLKEKSSDHDVYFSVDKLEATFSDPASTTDYYSVKVTRKQKYGNLKGVPKEGNRWQYDVYANNYQDYLNYLGREDEYEWCFDSLASNIVWPEMVTTSEPLINKKSELDDDFGFDEYKYFDDVYIFNDRR